MDSVHCEQCPGKDGVACVFSTTQLGQPASIKPSVGRRGCLFCSDEHLQRLLDHQQGAQITKTLAAIRKLSEEQFHLAIANLASRRGDDLAEEYRRRVLRSVKRAEVKARPKLSTQEQWAEALTARAAMLHQGKRQQKAYEKQVQRERAAARRKVFFPDEIRRHVTKETEEDEVW